MLTAIPKSKSCHLVLSPQEGDLSFGRAAEEAHGGRRSQGSPAVLPCFAAALLPSQLMDTHTHTCAGRDDDSDANPSWSVTLALSLSPEQTPSLSVTDTTALALQL